MDKVLQDALAALLRGDAETLDDALLELSDSDEDELPGYEGCSTFDDAGVMTRDAGLVLRFTDGTEYQLTLVRSR